MRYLHGSLRPCFPLLFDLIYSLLLQWAHSHPTCFTSNAHSISERLLCVVPRVIHPPSHQRLIVNFRTRQTSDAGAVSSYNVTPQCARGWEPSLSLSFRCILSLLRHTRSQVLYPLRSTSLTLVNISSRWLLGSHSSGVQTRAQGTNLNQVGLLIIFFVIYWRFEVKYNPVPSAAFSCAKWAERCRMVKEGTDVIISTCEFISLPPLMHSQ